MENIRHPNNSYIIDLLDEEDLYDH